MTVHSTVLLDIWWNMLIKFSKTNRQYFRENNEYKGELKPCHPRWSFLYKSLLASEVNSESRQTSKMELFAKIVKKEKPFTIFRTTSILDVWQGSEDASELASKVKDISFLNKFKYQRQQITFSWEKNKKKPPTKLQNILTKMLLNRTNSWMFSSGVQSSLHQNCHYQLMFTRSNLKVVFPPP